MEKIKSLDGAQKAKVNWAIEGDENSAFFHGMLKKGRRQKLIRCISIDGEWISDPNAVKKSIFLCF